MLDLFRFLSAIFLATMPILIVAVLGVGIYQALPNNWGILIIVILLVPGLMVSVYIFRTVDSKGLMNFYSAKYHSPDLDHLKPLEGQEHKILLPEEYVRRVQSGSNFFNKGSLLIFDDSVGYPEPKVDEIERVFFNMDKMVLTLKFLGGDKLEVYNPRKMIEGKSYLKILEANQVKLQWKDQGVEEPSKSMYFIKYTPMKKKVDVETNAEWYKSEFNVSLGKPALVINALFS